MAISQSKIIELFVTTFEKAPTQAELDTWTASSATTAAGLSSLMTADTSSVFSSIERTNTSTVDYINAMYQELFGRTADAEGLLYWSEKINGGNVSKNSFVDTLIDGAKNYSPTGTYASIATNDKNLVANKAAVAETFVSSGIVDATFAQSLVAAVSADASTVNIVQDLVTMVQADATAVTSATTTLVAVKDLVAANAYDLSTTLANLKTVVTNVAASAPTDLAATLLAVTTTVEAAKTDSSFVSDPTTLATNIETSPAAATVTAEATATPTVTETTLEKSGTASDLADGTVSLSGLHNATVTGVATIAQLTTIDGLTRGTVTATEIDDAIATINGASDLYSATTLTVTETSTSAALINTMNGLGSQALDISDVATITSSTIAHVLEIVNNTGATFTTAADYAATVSNTTGVDLADLKSIEDDTTGFVTATTVTAATGSIAEALEITVTDYHATTGDKIGVDLTNLVVTTDDTSVDASDIVDVDGALTNAIVVTTVTGVTEAYDTASLTTELTNAIGLLDADETIAVTGGAISAANAGTIGALTTGAVTMTITTGAVSTVNAVIANLATTDVITFTTDDTTGVDASDLVDINAVVDTSDYATVTGITEAFGTIGASAVEITDALALLDADETVAVTGGTITAANANIIANATGGVVTAEITGGTANATATSLANASEDALTINLTDTTVAAADLILLMADTSITLVDTNTFATVTGNATDLLTVFDGGASATAAGLAGSEAATLSGNIDAANAVSLETNAGTIDYGGAVIDASSLAGGSSTTLANTISGTNATISTGVTFGNNTSQVLANDGSIDWNLTGDTIVYETAADSSANVTLVLTGVTGVTELGGVFTLS